MKQERIVIANLKCSGCATTIQNKLLAMAGVTSVSIDQEEDSVLIHNDGTASRDDFTSALHALGYPEATEENGLLLQVKSYASCMVGRMKNTF
ncbi:MAG: heavy metal-associated domain-containing protein [Marinoscillum sp.]|uniref:heavy-metal-associated domain-containing protein n=1 Tax=Marinoscillum sp. TaxID=2024838 RepID=UPI003305387F